MYLDSNQKFEALKLRYTEQSEVLRHMKQNEFRLVSGFLTLQIILCAFFLKEEGKPNDIQILAIGSLDLFAAIGLTIMLTDYKKRRHEVVDTIVNIMKVFRFYETSYYREGIRINPSRPNLINWFHWYRFIIILSFIVTFIVIFFSLNKAGDITPKTPNCSVEQDAAPNLRPR